MPSSPYEVGDEVDLRVRVVSDYPHLGIANVYVGEVVGASGDAFWNIRLHRTQLDAGERVPRPIKVGDRVREPHIGGVGVVLGIDGGVAWTKYGSGIRRTPLVSDLVRVSP